MKGRNDWRHSDNTEPEFFTIAVKQRDRMRILYKGCVYMGFSYE